jgi:hypothetical protein
MCINMISPFKPDKSKQRSRFFNLSLNYSPIFCHANFENKYRANGKK